MTDKEKRQSNPFVGVLHEDEEILWFYTHPRRSLNLSMISRLARIFLILCAIGFILLLKMRADSEDGGTFIGELAVIMQLMVLMLPFILGFEPLTMYFFYWLRYERLNTSYAVTDQQLLRYQGGKVTHIPVEKISRLTLKGRTLSFDQGLGPWHNLEDADEVVQVIEEAREKRLNML